MATTIVPKATQERRKKIREGVRYAVPLDELKGRKRDYAIAERLERIQLTLVEIDAELKAQTDLLKKPAPKSR